jgi:ATP phosphoribosyltransferase regulatory subunit
VLALGHVGVFNGLLDGASVDPAALERLRERVDAKDAEGAREALAAANVPREAAAAVVRLTALSGGAAVLDEAERAVAFSPRARTALGELRATVEALGAAGLGPHVTVDLGEVRGLDYYTGLVFRAYAPGLGFEVGGGGRYDTLLARFGRPMPAVGFMLGLDRVALLLERQDADPAAGELAVESVSGADVGTALAQARGRRAAGARVRFGDGDPR